MLQTSSVSNSKKAVSFEIENGDTYSTIATKLKKQDLIKSEFFYKLYVKVNRPNNLMAGTYNLNKSMSVSKIIKTLREGLNARQMASIIAKKTDITEEEFLNKISDENYIDSLKEKYWFITDSVKNSQIYYDLEGYLFPDTYTFEIKELSLDNILDTILKNTDKKLSEVKDQVENSNYNIHQILTLASLVEQEAVTDEDRANVAGVFVNRLNNNWALGSDVTTYYAAKKPMTEKLTKAELDACNGYNTRCVTMKGLPVGPINNPSLSAIKAAVNPASNNYYYFVADSDKKVYFTKNANEHAQIIAKLKKEGKWIG